MLPFLLPILMFQTVDVDLLGVKQSLQENTSHEVLSTFLYIYLFILKLQTF